MKNLIKKYWIYLALCLAWGIFGVAIFGHFFYHVSYSTQKTINYDKTKVDTVTFDDGHTEVFKP